MNRSKPDQKKLLIHIVAAARPNFIKIAPLFHALRKEDWANPCIVHTGQHYDLNMSNAFFSDLDLPEPDFNLGVGSGSHAEQTGHVMIHYERLLIETRPDLVVVVGDVNSTLACALAASKVVYREHDSTNNINKWRRPLVAHLEAGLRSFDRTMPEEINRLLTDASADILWTHSPSADENLIREGIPHTKIQRVGNIMIDSLEMLRRKIDDTVAYKDFGLEKNRYGLVTLHRPSNVDDYKSLRRICLILTGISERIPLVFPIHPRTHKNLRSIGLSEIFDDSPGIFTPKPLNYINFMSLLFNCRLAITDSGGIQEETTYLGIPCVTLRPNTERPITITQGTNQLCEPDDLEERVRSILLTEDLHIKIPEFWDGQTANRAVQSIRNIFRNTINECQLATNL